MITLENFHLLLQSLNFTHNGQLYSKRFTNGVMLKVDFKNQQLIYPEDQGLKINERQTCNFSASENFVVFECVHRLLEKGYKPEHIELEPKWKIGHGASGGRADILVRDNAGNPLLIIECKTAGKEFYTAWAKTQQDGGQLFSYLQQDKATKFICLYTSDWDNKKINFNYHLIATQDTKNLLELYPEDDKNKPLFYKDAAKVEQLFQTWVTTYSKISYVSGIFEPEIQAYKIGQEKITAQHLKVIPNNEIQKKYNDFAEILRTHNVSSKESAFDKLVNLFLCKIVDETQSQQTGNELAFYWKGEQFDDYFSLIDRLQVLYKEGMKHYLGEEITYVNNEMIDNAFWAVKNDRHATKKAIMDYFKELKFFTNNDFGFIDVHNRKLFYQNAAILLDVIKMWQDVQLNGDQQHQFLGDMFEFFLDKGFKQSEGQFFTPIPICRFILHSLPLEALIKNNPKPPQLVDYACGAGHFLTEYAAQLKTILTEDKKALLSNYYQAIFGIEKEYRLSKVAKISTFMYGQGDINVIYCDALKEIRQQIKNKDVLVELESCDILVANPPFAVDFFLKNLSTKERRIYELINTVADEQNNRNIQCFFIERAKQLLAPNGIAGIIVPSSVLSNSDATHIATREILLKHFDIVAVVELGSGTFGKTGTNTVVLFLRRKAKIPTEAEQYSNRVLDWFDDDETMDIYQDEYIIREYCRHVGFEFEDYQNLLNHHLVDSLLATELFRDYTKAFEKSKQKITFMAYTQAIEKHKLFYFAMAWHNPQQVLIVKSPADNKAQKGFLGYEWSNAKGNEGIKYNGGNTVDEIITPLFDPLNRDNAEKLSYWIAQNFLGNAIDLSGLTELEGLVSTARLIDMLDFSLVEFNKTISITDKKSLAIETKWPLVKVESVLLPIEGNKTKIANKDILEIGKFPVVTQENGKIISGFTNVEDAIIDLPLVIFGDHSCTFKFIDFPFVRGADGTQLLKVNTEKYLPKCFFYLIQFVEIINSDKYERHFKYLANAKIPLPDLDIQEKIVAECEAIDKEVGLAQNEVEITKRIIEDAVKNVFSNSSDFKTLDKIADLSRGASPRPINDFLTEEINGVSWIKIGDVAFGAKYITQTAQKITEAGAKKSKFVKKGDFIISNSMSVGRPYILAIDGCVHDGWLVLANILESIDKDYLYYALSSETIQIQFQDKALGGVVKNLNIDRAKTVKIPVPDLETQKKLVAEIEKLEQQIQTAQQIINEAAEKKQAILKKYL